MFYHLEYASGLHFHSVNNAIALKKIKLVKCSVHRKGKERICKEKKRDTSCYKSEPDTPPVSQLTFASTGVLMNS